MNETIESYGLTETQVANLLNQMGVSNPVEFLNKYHYHRTVAVIDQKKVFYYRDVVDLINQFLFCLACKVYPQ
jgi:hypothetical protein